jgi:hypothetical protein
MTAARRGYRAASLVLWLRLRVSACISYPHSSLHRNSCRLVSARTPNWSVARPYPAETGRLPAWGHSGPIALQRFGDTRSPAGGACDRPLLLVPGQRRLVQRRYEGTMVKRLTKHGNNLALVIDARRSVRKAPEVRDCATHRAQALRESIQETRCVVAGMEPPFLTHWTRSWKSTRSKSSGTEGRTAWLRPTPTGANAAITFLPVNDWEPDFSEDELVDLTAFPGSVTTSKSALTETFEARCRPASEAAPGSA